MKNGILYIVPTPIGNLEDITLRALRILKEVDLIACEDTRQTVKLLNHYGIQKPLLSFYTHNQLKRMPEIITELNSGKNVALVSDSGTPGISDPGFFLIAKAIEEKFDVVSLPGPSAVITALVGSGLSTNGFIFLGFLKRKAGKLKKELKNAAIAGKTIVFYESPHRIKKTVSICLNIFMPDTQIVLAREITKKFEEYIRGTLQEVNETINNRELLGEFVVIIQPDKIQEESENGEGNNEYD